METDFHLITLLCFSACSLSNQEQQERQGTEAASGQPLWRDMFKCFCCSLRCRHVKAEPFQRARRNLFQPADAFYLPHKYKVGDMGLFFLKGPQGSEFCVMFQAPSVFGRYNLLLLLQRVTIAQSFFKTLSSINKNITLLPSCHFCLFTLSSSERVCNCNIKLTLLPHFFPYLPFLLPNMIVNQAL